MSQDLLFQTGLGGGSGGGVTSVAMTVPSVLSVAGSPITSTGTLALTYSGTALPVANGGTGLTGAAWTTYSPTLTPGTGSITSYTSSGRYQTIGKTTFITLTVTITNVGTGSGTATVSLPNTAASTFTLMGRESGVSGNTMQGFGGAGNTSCSVSYYNAGGVLATNTVINLCGVYENQ